MDNIDAPDHYDILDFLDKLLKFSQETGIYINSSLNNSIFKNDDKIHYLSAEFAIRLVTDENGKRKYVPVYVSYMQPLNIEGKTYESFYVCIFEDNEGKIHERLVGVYYDKEWGISSIGAREILKANPNNIYSKCGVKQILYID